MPRSPAGSPSPTFLTFQVCRYAPLTDTNVVVFDLNDKVTTWVHAQSFKMPQPEKMQQRASNIRTPGEDVIRWQYKNRHIQCSIFIRGASTNAISASVHALIAAIEQPPYCLCLALPGATQFTYADVVGCRHNIPPDPVQILGGAQSRIEIDFECRPGLRGDRLTLDNLVSNPGFESPMGGTGTLAPAVVAFNDSLATLNAYALQAGGALSSTVNNTYVDIVQSFAPQLYCRLGEASGTSAQDISGHANTGTYNGAPTLGVAGLLTGDTDTCVTFAAASSQYVDVFTAGSGLPTGNSPISIGLRFKFAANPASSQFLVGYGNGAFTAHNRIGLALDTTGHLNADVGTGAAVISGVLTTGVAHTALVTWDGTTLTLYVNGVSVGTPITPGAQTIPTSSTNFRIAATGQTVPGLFYSGQLDEVAVYLTALTSGNASTLHTAANTGATGTISNAMTVPSGGRQAFGSPAWGALQDWRLRFRWVSGLTVRFYLHYTDANNWLRCSLANSSMVLLHSIGGVVSTLATAAPVLVHEAWYWLECTQFPTVPGNKAVLQAQIWNDNAGTIAGGNVVTLANVVTQDASTALSGRPQIEAAGAALAIGGPYSSVHMVSLFGPGGWTFSNAAAGLASAAWEGAINFGGSGLAANTTPLGPMVSFGAARVDLPPAGACTVNWFAGDSSTAAQVKLTGIPVRAPGDVLGLAWHLRSSGVAGSCAQFLAVNEYDAAGAFLRQSAALGSVSGAQASWAQVSGTYTTGASCAFVLPFLGVVDATAGSANGTVWFDNVQCWNQTATGQASMPYCELRFPVSPAQLVVSGIQGDMVTPAYLALGTYVASWPPGATLSFWIGARIRSSAGANLIGHLHRQYAAGMATQLSPFTSDFGGWESQLSTDAANVTLAAFSFPPADAIGVWHLLYRIRSLDAFSPSLQKITAHGLQTVSQFPWAGYLANPTALTASVAGPTVNPLPAFGGWVVADAGQLFAYGTSPSGTPTGGLIDPAQNNVTTSLVFNDANAALFDTVNWALLLPVDGGLLLGSMANGASSGVTISTSWLWIYIDGLGTQTNSSGAGAATTSSFESVPVPNPAHGVGGGLGTASSPTSISAAVSTGEPFLVLDPTQHLGGVTVNQLVGLLTNNAGDVLPLHSSLQYWPLYLTLR